MSLCHSSYTVRGDPPHYARVGGASLSFFPTLEFVIPGIWLFSLRNAFILMVPYIAPFPIHALAKVLPSRAFLLRCIQNMTNCGCPSRFSFSFKNKRFFKLLRYVLKHF